MGLVDSVLRKSGEIHAVNLVWYLVCMSRPIPPSYETKKWSAYNFARRLKTLGGLTPYEYICKIRTSEPDRFILNPIHQMPGLNT